jgi:hypothetical protein
MKYVRFTIVAEIFIAIFWKLVYVSKGTWYKQKRDILTYCSCKETICVGNLYDMEAKFDRSVF